MTARHFISTLLVVALLVPGMTLTHLAAPGSPGVWRISCVDCPKWFGELTDRSLRLDAAGHPHIAYGGDHLYYAYHDGEMWRYETADWTPGVGSSPSLDLDSSGQPHIAYHDSQNGDLKYAFRDGAGWRVMTADTGAADSPVGETARLGLDSAGHPHIVYSDNSNYALKYAYLEPTGWRVEQVGHALCLGAPFSLAVSSNGVPHLCYFDADYDPVYEVLVHAYREDTTWILEEIGPGFASPCSLALDADDHPYIIANKSGNESAVVHWTGGSWHTETIHWAGYHINGLSLALSADGFPHVSATFWYGAEPGYPVWQYKYRDQQGWNGLLSSGSVELGQTSLALDADGRPFVSYPTREGLALVAFDGTTWRTETIDSSENVGRFSSLALDSASRPVVAYSGQSASIKVASWTGASWAVDDFPQFLRYGHVSGVSLAVDSEDRPHVAHAWDFITTWEYTLYSLTYRYSDATGWHVETVRENQCCSLHRPSLALDTGDVPQITIVHRQSGYDTIHLRRIASDWASTLVVRSTDAISAMDLDEDGNPIIGYGQDDAVKVASYDIGGWRFEIVDAAGGSDVSLMLDAAGSPRLSYANLTGDLMHAYRNAQGWHVERVTTGVFQETSLAIDSSGYSHISAYDATHADLIYAYQNAAGWHMETVEASGQVGLGNSLALDVADQPIISFHDAVTGDLKLAVRETGPAPTLTPTPTPTSVPTPLPKIGHAFYTDSPPTIDGSLADWPAGSGVRLDRWQAADYGGLITGASDASATCYGQWTATHLYAGCRANDDMLFVDDGDDWWKDDALELVYDGLNDNQSYGADDHKYEMRIDGFSDYNGPVCPGVFFAMRLWYGGYTVEISIPAAALGTAPMHGGRVIGLNIGLIDDDDGGEADGWLGWSGNTWRRADLCGDLILLPSDATATPTRTATATPTATSTPAIHDRYLPLIMRR